MSFANESIGAHIGLVAQLVPQLDQVVQSERRERLAAVVAQYRQEWLTSTFPLAQPFNQAVNPSCQAISRTSHSGAVVPQAAPLQLESGPQAEEVLDGEALGATEDVGQAPTRSG